jgi:hypothetical protein
VNQSHLAREKGSVLLPANAGSYGGAMTFSQFRQLVDAEVSRHCGLTADCLPDIDFWNYFDTGMDDAEVKASAIDCAHDLLSEEGFPFGDE